jgi:hypothetical protein
VVTPDNNATIAGEEALLFPLYQFSTAGYLKEYA